MRKQVMEYASGNEMAAIANDAAPEHLEVHTKDSKEYSKKLYQFGSLFIGEDAFNSCRSPLRFASRSWYSFSCKLFCNHPGGFAMHEISVNAADQFGLFGVNNQGSVGAFIVAKEVFIGKADSSVRCSFPLAPGNVLR